LPSSRNLRPLGSYPYRQFRSVKARAPSARPAHLRDDLATRGGREDASEGIRPERIPAERAHVLRRKGFPRSRELLDGRARPALPPSVLALKRARHSAVAPALAGVEKIELLAHAPPPMLGSGCCFTAGCVTRPPSSSTILARVTAT